MFLEVGGLWPIMRIKLSLTGRLLLLIAILFGLVLLLSPYWVHKARSEARRVSCFSNVKSIGLSFAMYADVNQDRLPMDSSDPTLIGSLRMLSNTLSWTKVLICPNDRRINERVVPEWSKLTAQNI